jgi:hypothetical protein
LRPGPFDVKMPGRGSRWPGGSSWFDAGGEECDVANTSDRTAGSAGTTHPRSPEGMVIGAVEAPAIEAATAALAEAGFPADGIDIMTSDELDDLDSPIDRPGLRGLVNRFLFSLGDDLDELETARQHLQEGRVLIGVPVMGHDAIHRAADILRANGAPWVTHFGRWTITSL